MFHGWILQCLVIFAQCNRIHMTQKMFCFITWCTCFLAEPLASQSTKNLFKKFDFSCVRPLENVIIAQKSYFFKKPSKAIPQMKI